MPISEQPAVYPRWATDGGASVTEPSEGDKDIGWVADDPEDEATTNWLHRTDYEWLVHLDARCMGYEYTERDATWVEPTFRYDGAANTALLPATPGVVWLDGKRLDLSADYLASIGEDEHTFTVPSATYIGVNADRELEFQEVAILDPAPTPSAGYTHVLRVVVTVGDTPDNDHLIPTTPMLRGPLSISGDIPTISRGTDLVGGDFSHSNWGGAASITIAANSKQSRGTITMNSPSGPATATPQIVLTFPTPYDALPHGVVQHARGTGTGVPRFDITITTTTMTIDAVGATTGAGGNGNYVLSWVIEG